MFEKITVDQKIEIMKLAMGNMDKYKEMIYLITTYPPDKKG